MTRAARVEVYRDRAGRWRWRHVAGNGEKIAASQAYARKDSARRGAARAVPGVTMVEA